MTDTSLETMVMTIALTTRAAVDRIVAIHPDNPDLPTRIGAWRDEGDECVEIVDVITRPDRDTMLEIASDLRTGCAADLITLTMDAYQVNDPINPDTGESWGDGEMQAYRAKHGEDGVVLDSMNVLVAGPEDIWMIPMPYIRKGKRVRWLTDQDLGPASREGMGVGPAGGYVADVLTNIMNTPPMDVREYPGRLPEGVDLRALSDSITFTLIAKQFRCTIASRYYAEPENMARMETAQRKASETFLLDMWRN